MTKDPRLRAYNDDTLDLLKTFDEFEINFVPRNQNMLANGLAIATSTCKRPCENKQYSIQEKFRPAIPDNEKYWQVFDGDKQIEDFLQSINEFGMPKSDSEYEQDCPAEETSSFKEGTSLQIADINLLSDELEHET